MTAKPKPLYYRNLTPVPERYAAIIRALRKLPSRRQAAIVYLILDEASKAKRPKAGAS